MDLKSGYARLPIALSSATGLDLPLRLPGKTSARMATTTTDFLPPLLTVTFSRSDRPGLAIEKLTGTERKVLSLVLEGMSNRAISEHLGRSIATTQNHVHAILAKLQAGDRRELLIRANHSLRPEPQPVPGLQPMEALPLPPRKLVHSPHQKSESA
jgi:DNA-binding CsgD family transcriptional regulator